MGRAGGRRRAELPEYVRAGDRRTGETEADGGDRDCAAERHVSRACCWRRLGRVRRVSAAPTPAATRAAGARAAATPFGAYLAGRHAQEERDYRAAARMVRGGAARRPAIARADQPHLFDGGRRRPFRPRRVPLAEQALKLDGSDAVADLVLLVDRVKAGDNGRARSPAPRRCRMTGCTAMSARWRSPGRGWAWATSPAPTRRCKSSTNSTASPRSNISSSACSTISPDKPTRPRSITKRRSTRPASSTGG